MNGYEWLPTGDDLQIPHYRAIVARQTQVAAAGTPARRTHVTDSRSHGRRYNACMARPGAVRPSETDTASTSPAATGELNRRPWRRTLPRPLETGRPPTLPKCPVHCCGRKRPHGGGQRWAACQVMRGTSGVHMSGHGRHPTVHVSGHRRVAADICGIVFAWLWLCGLTARRRGVKRQTTLHQRQTP